MENNDQVRRAVEVLEKLTTDAAAMSDLPVELRESLMRAAGQLSRPARTEMRLRNRSIDKARRQKKQANDREVRSNTGIREARKEAVFTAPKQIGGAATEGARILENPRKCYVCKEDFTHLHFFYDSMCVPCGDFNYAKRFQRTDLTGQTALITGARLKIGYHAGLMMLRSGARVIVTTRFPVDAALRYGREEDFSVWGDRLHVHGLDLRHTPSVELFAGYFERTYDRLDILINNAAQTVRRPPGFYAHMLNQELAPFESLTPEARQILGEHRKCTEHLRSVTGARTDDSALPTTWHGQGLGVGISDSARLSQIPYSYDNSLTNQEIFPEGKLDADLQQVDLRTMNSWRLKLTDVSTPEMLEVQLVNSVAPFVLCSRLTPLMRKNPTGQKHIVNVTAMEGKFTRYTKTDKHPHTNMAKAALNMLVHTSARDLVNDGIYMNAVDTGWVTDEDPAQISQRKQKDHDFQPPLDIVDGAARICDPFIDGINTGTHWCGKFLKDYFPTEW